MAGIGVIGAGAFGTALAVTLAAGGAQVRLWARSGADEMAVSRVNARRLPGVTLPEAVEPTGDLQALAGCDALLLAVPMQELRATLPRLPEAADLVLCCKGIERGTGMLATEVAQALRPAARSAVLTGPSFARDIARGLPTALTLACSHGREDLQAALSTPTLRLYLSDDPLGAQLGGALKNVIAIAAGVAIGAGLGDSARAALMTRGFAEIARQAVTRGARAETLWGLSGFGDLVLTCTSEQSRNYQYGLALGAGRPADTGATVEGVATALAIAEGGTGADMPVTSMVAELIRGAVTLDEAIGQLLSRPLRRE